MVTRRAWQAGISTLIGNHTFRAIGFTNYLKNDGQLDKAAQMAAYAATRTTQLYDRRRDEVSLDEAERIGCGVRLKPISNHPGRVVIVPQR